MSPDLDLSGFDPTRLSRLWSTAGGGEGGRTTQSADLAEALRFQLGARVDQAAFGGNADGGAATGSFSGTCRELLLHPSPPPAAVRRVKDWAKPRMSRDDAEVPSEVAGVIYFAAVAADRVRGTGAVSGLPDERVRRGAAWALRLPWLADPDLTDLFRAAAEVGTGVDSTADVD